MEKAIAGKDKVLVFRLEKERPYKKAGLLALQVSHTYKSEGKTESTQTKDGAVVGGGGNEASIDLEALLSDTEVCKLLEYAQATSSTVEVWEINVSKPMSAKDKFEARYATGLIESWEIPAEVDSNTSIKTTMKLNGSLDFMKSGATLEREEQEIVKLMGYDTIKDAKAEELVGVYQPTTSEPELEIPSDKASKKSQ